MRIRPDVCLIEHNFLVLYCLIIILFLGIQKRQFISARLEYQVHQVQIGGSHNSNGGGNGTFLYLILCNLMVILARLVLEG